MCCPFQSLTDTPLGLGLGLWKCRFRQKGEWEVERQQNALTSSRCGLEWPTTNSCTLWYNCLVWLGIHPLITGISFFSKVLAVLNLKNYSKGKQCQRSGWLSLWFIDHCHILLKVDCAPIYCILSVLWIFYSADSTALDISGWSNGAFMWTYWLAVVSRAWNWSYI